MPIIAPQARAASQAIGERDGLKSILYLRAQAHPVMAVQQQSAQVEQFLAWPANRREANFYQQLQDQLGVASIMFLLAGFRRADFRGVPQPAIRFPTRPAAAKTTA